MGRTWITLISMFCLLLTACLEDSKKAATVVASTESWFDGVKSAKNLGGTTGAAIKVEWPASLRSVMSYRVYSLIENPETKANEWTVIGELAPEALSYVHSDLVPGRVYTYKVQAVDLEGKEDGNKKQVSTVVFEGIAAVKITGKTTATVSLNSSLGAFDEIRIYAKPVRAGGTRKLVATATGNVTSINVTGLQSGTNYRFYANAYMSYMSAEDGNEVFVTGQTHSESFGSGAATDTNYAYNGIRLVQGFGNAPNAPVDPKVPTIKIVWNAFDNATSSTKYKVVRVSGRSRIDTTTETACTADTNDSCVVCTVTGTGPRSCDDTALAAPPKKYDYTITLVRKNSASEEYVEEMPLTNAGDFMFSAHVPPSYMVLVQRDSANYEMCNTMRRAQDPRKKNRCPYTGLGAVPYNSGPGKQPLNLESSYYDFGYNLFVDRYHTACKWTRNSCGPDGCIGVMALDNDNNGTAETGTHPSNTIGNDGDVFYGIAFDGWPNCYVKKAGVWKDTRDSTLDLPTLAKALTNDPGEPGKKHRPMVGSMQTSHANNACQAQGKRLLRRREWMAAAVFPYLEGEPNATNDIRSRWLIQGGTEGQANNAGNCANWNTATMLPGSSTIPQLIAATNTRTLFRYMNRDLGNVIAPYFIGTPSTWKCVTRVGIQDPFASFGFGSTWFSDQFSRTSAVGTRPHVLRGEVSDFDDGNKDLVGFEFSTAPSTNGPGPMWDVGATQSTASKDLNYSNTQTWFPNWIAPLGIPFVSTPVAGQVAIGGNDLYNQGETAGNNGGLNVAGRVTHGSFDSAAGRFWLTNEMHTRWSFTTNVQHGTGRTGAICAQEAE